MPRGSAGEDENGSKAGRRDAAVLLMPATGGTGVIFLLGEGAMMVQELDGGLCRETELFTTISLTGRARQGGYQPQTRWLTVKVGENH